VLDPDASIERLEPMLKRLIREDLSFRVALGARGARIRMDAAQLEQVLMNLVLNSRDAMPSGGELVLSTERVRVDGDVAAADPSAQAGPHVMISVSDTGAGIEAADLDRIFDPFFTTKGVGRGTGLGLASAHGIVTHAGGHIRVESAPHQGTTFRVYFPEVADAPASESPPAREAGSLDGSGTILLCEDDDAVRRITLRTLEGAGYRVIEAESAEAAIAWMRNDATPIDLLISDVILPRMNGGVLAGVVVEERPGVRVLLVSGYTANVLEDSGVPSDVELLEKPFKPETLLARVAALLREPPSR
jgi:CheY-like chemotaxis protein